MTLNNLLRTHLPRNVWGPGFYVVEAGGSVIATGEDGTGVRECLTKALGTMRHYGERIPTEFKVTFLSYGMTHPGWYEKWGLEAPATPGQGVW